MIKKSIQELLSLSWTLGGTGLVLITLSGGTRTAGIWITAASIVLHYAGVLIPWEDDSDKSGQSED